MQGLKRLLWEPYVRALDKNPLLVKSCTAALLMGVGDGVSQGIERITYFLKSNIYTWLFLSLNLGYINKRAGKPFKYEVARTARMAAIGMFMSGPLMHAWYDLFFASIPYNAYCSEGTKC